MTEPKLYFEDVEIGDGMETPGQTVSEADVIRYAGLTGEWDERFTDAMAVRTRENGTRVVPELLALCVSSGLGWRGSRLPLAVTAFMGFDWQFLKPLRIGDTIWSRSRTLAKRSLKDGGVVVEGREILNQRGEVVQSGKLTLLVAKRPPR
jgi:acyl dehydratase